MAFFDSGGYDIPVTDPTDPNLQPSQTSFFASSPTTTAGQATLGNPNIPGNPAYGGFNINASTPGTSTFAQPSNLGQGWQSGLTGVTNETQAYQLAEEYGHSGQDAIDWVNQNYPAYANTAGQWYPDKGVIGLPDGSYINQNATGGPSLVQNQGDSGAQNASTAGPLSATTSAASPLQGPVGNFSYPTFNESLSLPTWDQTLNLPSFTAPTGVTEQNDPGYTSALNAVQRGVQNSAAAKGTLLTTGTQLDLGQQLANYTANVAYPQVYNQALSAYQTNANSQLQSYQQNYSQFQNQQAADIAQYQADFGQYETGFNNALQTNQSNFGQNTTAAQLSLAAQQQNFSQNLNNAYLGLFGQNQGFQQQFNLAGLGLGASEFNTSNQTGLSEATIQALLGGSNAGQGYTSNAGNINAAGQIAGGNIAGGALGNLSNQALLSYLLNQQQTQTGYTNPGGYQPGNPLEG